VRIDVIEARPGSTHSDTVMQLIRKPAVVALTGNATYALAQLGVLVVLAQFTSGADVGRYALALAIAAPVQIGVGMRLRTVRVIQDPTAISLRDYLSLAVMAGVFAVLVSSVIGLAAGGDDRTTATIVLIAVSKATESLIDVSYGELQRRGRFAAITASQILRGGLTLAAATVGALIDRSVVGAAVAINVVWFVQFILLDARRTFGRRNDPGDRARPQAVLALARLAWPLGLAAALTSLSAVSPRYVISAQLTAEDLGIFAVLSYPTTAMVLFANSLGQASLLSMSVAFRVGNRKRFNAVVVRMTALIAGVGVLACLVILAVGNHLLVFAFGPLYGGQVGVAAVLMLTATVGGLAAISYYALTSTGSFVFQPVVTAAVVVIGIPLVWIGTARSGLIGTAWVMLFVLGLQGVLMTCAAIRRVRAAHRTTL